MFLILQPSSSQIFHTTLYNYSRTDFKLRISNKVVLDCTKFTPEKQYAGEKFPAIIFLHGLGGSKNDVIPFAEDYARYGYLTFAYSMRGQGESTGYSNLISTSEMKDLLYIINVIKHDSLVNRERVALVGSSQGGILAFMAACSGADVRCIVSELSSPEFASSWLENGCIKTSLLWSLGIDSSSLRYNKRIKRFRDWILEDNKYSWDSLSLYLPIDRDFPERVGDLKCPIMTSNAWQDKYFNGDDMLKASEKMPCPYVLYFGPVAGHGSDTTAEENSYRANMIASWLEHWLFDAPNNINDTCKIIFASSTEPINYRHWAYTRDSISTYPPDNAVELRFYFHSSGKLGMETQELEDTASFLNDVEDTTLTMGEAVFSNFTGYDFNRKFARDYIYFETEALTDDITLFGSPKMYLTYSSTAGICQFNFQIWEVTPDGGINFVTRINYTDRHYMKGTLSENYFKGEASSHIFRKGNRIRVYVTNLDNGPYDGFLGTNPFVLPVLIKAKNTIYFGGSYSTFIEMPVK